MTCIVTANLNKGIQRQNNYILLRVFILGQINNPKKWRARGDIHTKIVNTLKCEKFGGCFTARPTVSLSDIRSIGMLSETCDAATLAPRLNVVVQCNLIAVSLVFLVDVVLAASRLAAALEYALTKTLELRHVLRNPADILSGSFQQMLENACKMMQRALRSKSKYNQPCRLPVIT